MKGEYKCHRIGHTDLKPYACGVCGEAKSATQGQLNAHLQRCGKPNQSECQICHKTYSTDQNRTVHVREVHKKNTSEQVTWECPLCEGSVYSSEGGYYKHLQKSHGIGRHGKKLEKEFLKQEQQKKADGANDGQD